MKCTLETVAEIKTAIGTLLVKRYDSKGIPGFYTYMERPNGKRYLISAVEVDQEREMPAVLCDLYTPDSNEESPSADMEISQADFENMEDAAHDVQQAIEHRLEELISSYDIIDFDGKQYVPVNDPMKSSEDWLIADAICLEDEPDDQGNWPRYSIEWELKGEPEDQVIAWGWWTPDCVLRMDGRYNIITGDLY